MKQLVLVSGINQVSAIKLAKSDILENIKTVYTSFLDYVGISVPTSMFSLVCVLISIFSVVIVLFALGFTSEQMIAGKKQTATALGIMFGTISILAVVISGLVIITLRPIYFFCWHILVVFSAIYLLEIEWNFSPKLLRILKNLLLSGIIISSMVNSICTFGVSFSILKAQREYYENIVTCLREDGIQYLYSDWRTERNMLSTVSNDEITYCTLNFSNDTSDLWTRRKCLYWTDWFEVSNFQNAYIVLTNKSLLSLQTDFSEEYYQAFMANVELKHTFIGREETIYFYKGSEKLYKDILN